MCGILGLSCGNCRKERQHVFHRLMTCGNDISHRGEQAWGILTADRNRMFCYRQEGRFSEGITETKADLLAKKMQGNKGLAHTLYSTIGKSGQKKQPKNIQPRMAKFHGKPFGLAYNGNVYDLSLLRKRAKKAGWKFESKVSDTEVILALIATSQKKDFVEALKEVLPLLKGAFALAILYDGKIFGVRDRCGIRPLCIGYNEDGFILSSESCAFYPVDAKFLREVRPGEIVVIGDKGVEKYIKWADDACCKFCIFEFVYFARPDSRLCNGRSAYYYRNKAGIILAKEAPVKADLIISAPAGGDIFAEAYASELGIPLRQGLFKNRFGIRTFMAPRGTNRRELQRIKLHPLEEVIWGKRICLVEDSLVRNNVCPETVAMCFEAGATAVHVRIASAPIIAPCFYGVDMATKRELAAANFKLEEIREQIGADSLAYISLDGMIKATGLPKENLCMACFDGNYPVPPPVETD
jgi:amidophosphoribosyltransferase